jgi:outer membrane protein OmpA-like peptidoglycan-associated protein
MKTARINNTITCLLIAFMGLPIAAANEELEQQIEQGLGLGKPTTGPPKGLRTRGIQKPVTRGVQTRSGVALKPRGAKRVSADEAAAIDLPSAANEATPASPPPKEIAALEVAPAQAEVYADSAVQAEILFKMDSAEVRTDDSKSVAWLESLAKVFNKHPDTKVLIEGHTCDLGADAYNLRLSAIRAEVIRQHLIRSGITPGRIQAMGFGENEVPDSLHDDDKSPAAETLRQQCRKVVVRERKG